MNVRTKLTTLFSLALLWLSAEVVAAPSALAQSLTRGPYLQNGSTSAISVRWRTRSRRATS